MKPISFWGESDDLVEVDGDPNIPGVDEYPTDLAEFAVAGLYVRVRYEDNGCWSIATWPIHQDIPVKADNIQMCIDANKYSMHLEMDIPDDAYILRIP